MILPYSIDILKENKMNYDWKTLYVGVKLGLIGNSEITKYALEFLSTHEEGSHPLPIDLAWGENDEDDYLSKLQMIVEEYQENLKENPVEWNIEKRKWRYSILNHLNAKYKDTPKELLDKIAEVYADFDYPEDMETFITYMPPKDGCNSLSSLEKEKINRLISLFYEFLHNEQASLGL
ncbi:DUF2247 family protein [Fictibacillus fluitans]|uniref:DUF2247 family protein n=1 Tax=Fictibacillus fluitans TaxID=3058422 RepID=A0ABT8HT79_9BACL|nr:DUF2247 family protein [Fictibacillus sp. NE201]MDN4523975.1 DUF2247 family protein [Fictibacillus sp. NE201]